MTTPAQPTDPVLPWGSTVAGVRDLLPDATIYPAGALPAGRRGVTEPQTRTWLVGLTGRASLYLDGWEKLSDTVEDGASLSDRQRFADLARDAVQNGAASYVEAARFPEQQTKATTSYAAVLWERYEATLAQLKTWLDDRLSAGIVDPTTGAVTAAIEFDFPPPSFTVERLRF